MSARTLAIVAAGVLLVFVALWSFRSPPEDRLVGAGVPQESADPRLKGLRATPVTTSGADAAAVVMRSEGQEAGRPASGERARALSEVETRWLRRINATRNKATLNEVLVALAAEPPGLAFEVLQHIFERVSALQRRLGILNFFGRSAPGRAVHPRALDVLDLGTRDPLLRVANRAFDLFAALVYRDFAEDPAAYDTWRQAHEGLSAREVIQAGASELVARLRGLEGDALKAALWHEGLFTRKLDHVAALRAAGGRELAHAWWTDVRTPEAVRSLGMRWISAFGPDADFLRDHVRPILRNPRGHSDRVIRDAVHLLARHGGAWVFSDFVAAFETVPSKSHWWNLTHALAALGDERAIPPMIGIIEADNTYDSVYGVGHFGLKPLTGVAYNESHDGAWWRAWWEKNRQRFKRAGAMDIPQMSPVAR